jgi:hypothetical protein
MLDFVVFVTVHAAIVFVVVVIVIVIAVRVLVRVLNAIEVFVRVEMDVVAIIVDVHARRFDAYREDTTQTSPKAESQ